MTTKPSKDTLDDVIRELGKPYKDFRFLLECLDEVINHACSPDNYIPWLTDNEPDELSNKEMRIFSLAFHLLNITEENGAIQYRRGSEIKKGTASINGSWAKNLKELKSNGYTQEQITENLSQLIAEPVLTAHPTEAMRATILEHHRELYLLLVKRENKMWTPIEQSVIKNDIKAILERLIGTGDIFIEKPELSTEVNNVMHYFTNSFPKILPLLDEKLRYAWEDAGFAPETLKTNNYPNLRLGNWVGGDRDGHPFVTADFTREVLSKFRLNALIVIRRSLTKLVKQLSFTGSIDKMPPAFQLRMIALEQELGSAYKEVTSRNNNEAVRQFIGLCMYRLPLNVKREHAIELFEHQHAYRFKQQLLDDLVLLDQSLIQMGFSIAHNGLHEAIRSVQTFGFHLAAVDVRQNSSFHDKAIGQLLKIAGAEDTDFPQWPFDKRVEWFETELQTIRPLSLVENTGFDEAQKVISSHLVLNDHIKKYGAEGLGVMIVSMTRHQCDLYALYLLGRESGLTCLHNGKIIFKVPVVPLFETIEDLNASAEVMDAFFSHPITKNSLEYHKTVSGCKRKEQLIMVGYSDSNKDGGILASQWALYKGQSELSEIGQKHGVEVQYFHGKGGTISRGAGPTHHFINALPPHSVNGKLRLTEQGESISQKYANPLNGSFNLELLLANSLSKTIMDKTAPKEEYRYAQPFAFISKTSFIKYRELVDHKHFLTFYGQATPIDVIESSKIGSRPSRRTGTRTLDDLRAIPWVFSWSQARFNITGWFGVGTALRSLRQELPEQYEHFRTGLTSDHMIRYVFTNIETLLSSTNEDVMQEYAGLVQNSEARTQIMEMILEELSLTRDEVALLHDSQFNDRRKNYALSNKLRGEGLWKLHTTQISLLKRWRASKESNLPDTDELLLSLLMSVNGIAGALKGTG